LYFLSSFECQHHKEECACDVENDEVLQWHLALQVDSHITHVLHQPDAPQESARQVHLVHPDTLECIFVLSLQPLVEESVDKHLEDDCDSERQRKPDETLFDDSVKVTCGFCEHAQQQKRGGDWTLDARENHQDERTYGLSVAVAGGGYIEAFAREPLLADVLVLLEI